MGIKVERPDPVKGQAPRITELWAWVALDPMTNTEGIIAAKTTGGGGLPLVTTMKELADRYKPIAEAMVAAAQEPRPTATLKHFVLVDE